MSSIEVHSFQEQYFGKHVDTSSILNRERKEDFQLEALIKSKVQSKCFALLIC